MLKAAADGGVPAGCAPCWLCTLPPNNATIKPGGGLPAHKNQQVGYGTGPSRAGKFARLWLVRVGVWLSCSAARCFYWQRAVLPHLMLHPELNPGRATGPLPPFVAIKG